MRILIFLLAIGALTACQQPQSAPSAPQSDVKAPSTAELPADNAAGEMPAAWKEADGPGVTSILVEDQGQSISLECSQRDSLAATSPGKVLASATWRANENPPKSQDVALFLEGAAFRADPIWARDTGRDSVSIQLEPTPELIDALKRDGAMRITAGDWFLAVGPDTRGLVKAFADRCAQFTR